MKAGRRRSWSCLLLAFLVGAATLSGCQIDYYLHLACGQWRVISGSVAVEKVIADTATPARVRDRLLLVARVKKLMADSLGFSPGDTYTDYFDTSGKPASYVLSACARDSFHAYTWWFPIVGDVPYKGFFDREFLESERAELSSTMDVYVGRAAAFSTLGWFDDPILSSWLNGGIVGDMVDLVIHELLHREVYLSSSARFNETLATFVGYLGTIGFLKEEFGEDSPELAEYLATTRDDRRFTRSFHRLRLKLERYYQETAAGESDTGRVMLYRDAVREILAEPFERNDYSWLAETEPNNAMILAMDRYYGDLPFFEAFFLALRKQELGELGNLRAMIDRLRGLSSVSTPRKTMLAMILEEIPHAEDPAGVVRLLEDVEPLDLRGFEGFLDARWPAELRDAVYRLLIAQTGEDLGTDPQAWRELLDLPIAHK